ncbi:MAG: DivIVA domain-containing protein [Clostridiales bacterium]|nr:DivIVA domain-containing protein [Clostridiales bacterium]
MAITVEMIEQKEFKTKVRGYDPIEVDEFLDEIADELIALQDEIANLHQQLIQARAQGNRPQRPEVVPAAAPAPPRPQVSQTMAKEQEETLRQLLVNAQRVSDETVAEAHDRAEKIVDEAEKKASDVLANIRSEKDSMSKEVEELKQAAKDYRNRFIRLIEDQKHVLKAEKELFEEEN